MRFMTRPLRQLGEFSCLIFTFILLPLCKLGFTLHLLLAICHVLPWSHLLVSFFRCYLLMPFSVELTSSCLHYGWVSSSNQSKYAVYVCMFFVPGTSSALTLQLPLQLVGKSNFFIKDLSQKKKNLFRKYFHWTS